jgi:hypothetical protein
MRAAARGEPVFTVIKSEQMIPLAGVVSVVNTPMVPRVGKNGRVIGNWIGGSIVGNGIEVRRAISS